MRFKMNRVERLELHQKGFEDGLIGRSAHRIWGSAESKEVYMRAWERGKQARLSIRGEREETRVVPAPPRVPPRDVGGER